MTPEEAIGILELHVKRPYADTRSELRKAEKLGIEALKRTSARRETLSWKFEPLLPGETT